MRNRPPSASGSAGTASAPSTPVTPHPRRIRVTETATLAVEVSPGGTIDVQVQVDPTPTMACMDLRLVAGVSGAIELTGATLYSPWDENSSSIQPGVLNPKSALLTLSVPMFGSEQISSPMANLSFAVRLEIPPGLYTLNATDILWVESRAATVMPFPGAPGEDLLVHVVPEPAAIGLLSVAGLLISRRRNVHASL